MARRSYSGNAVPTKLVGGITDTALSMVLADATGHPDGTLGPWVETIDRGSTEEAVLCQSRAGTTVTISVRGYDGTTAAAHGNGATVEHTGSKTDYDEANDHLNTTTRDDHTQYAKRGQGLAANVGSASRAGRLYIATDSEDLYADDGTTVHRYLSKPSSDAAYAQKAGDTFTGPIKVDRGVLADAAGSVRDGAETITAAIGADRASLLSRMVRGTAGPAGQVSAFLELVRLVSINGAAAVTQVGLRFFSDRAEIAGGELRVPAGRMLQRGKGGAVLNLLGVGDALTGTVDAATTGLQSTQAATNVVTTDANGVFTIGYPAAFTTGVVSVVACPGDDAGTLGQIVVKTYSLTGFTGVARTAAGALIANSTGIRVNYIAFGS